ncbi:DUF4359 domain-containing protein [Fischerella sp. PCC 9605]|uniref:DUF4359 domain-containing protein n=1 Tax=Fischerella sp. PCC 9605 TaxID=1173024 RepID=UPI000479E376|nr:DUF4359 domain-containing protein [Fischerella sp. PCC 9605]
MNTKEQYSTSLDLNHPLPQQAPLHKPSVRILPIIGLLLIPLFLALTNPSQKGYEEYVVWKLKQTTCKQKSLKPETQLSCAFLSNFPYNFSARALSGYIRRENYLFFSIYTTDAFGLRDRSVGISGHYFDWNFPVIVFR